MDDDYDFLNHIRPDKAIRLILEGTAADVGERFFYSLVENLSLVLQTAGAWVTEYISAERRLNSLAFLFDNQWLDNFSYDISGTICERVIVEKQLVYVPDRLLDLYIGNAELAELEHLLRKKAAMSYLGVPFIDDQNHVLGHLSVIDTRTIPENQQTFDIFRIFANRASAELQRLRAEQHIMQSEEKFRKLFDSTFDAIIEYDRDLIIKRVNQAAEKLFATSSTALTDKQLKDFFTEPQYEKLRDLALTLTNQPSDKQSIWIPGGLKISAMNGECFPAEGTLSKYAFGPNHYFILILRDEKQRVEAENKIHSMSLEANYLREEIKTLGNFGEIIGKSEPLLAVLEKVKQVAQTNATVLITGETGTGKEAIARSIHKSSNRNNKPLITVNCAAIPSTLVESEFFGHVKGAFTGATNHRHGRFALADKGTIFLDEVGELPMNMQAKLLRVLQEGEFESIGSSTTIHVDIRVIAATNRNLVTEIEAGTFREDLYYRLNVFPIELPPLRERGKDVIELALHFISKFTRSMGREARELDQKDIELLKSYNWPGNVRELQNVIERAVIISSGSHITLQRVIPSPPLLEHSGSPLITKHLTGEILTASELQRLECDSYTLALERTGWRVSGVKGAAHLLGINPSTFVSRMKKLGIERP